MRPASSRWCPCALTTPHVALLALLLGPAAGSRCPAQAPPSGEPTTVTIRLGDYTQHGDMVAHCLRSEVHHPIRLCVAFDISGSMKGDLPDGESRIRKARREWEKVARVGLLPGDRVAIIGFANTVQELLPETEVRAEDILSLAGRAPSEGQLCPYDAAHTGTVIGYADHDAVQRVLRDREPRFAPCVLLISDGFDDEVPEGHPGREQWLPYRSRPPGEGYTQWRRDLRDVWHLVIGTETDAWPIVKHPGEGIGEGRIGLLQLFVREVGGPAIEEARCTVVQPSTPGGMVTTEPPQLTNHDGATRFAVAAGTYQLAVEKQGFRTDRRRVAITAMGANTQNIFLGRPFRLDWRWIAAGAAAVLLPLLLLPWPFGYGGARVWTFGVIPVHHKDLGIFAWRSGFRLKHKPATWLPRGPGAGPKVGGIVPPPTPPRKIVRPPRHR